MSMSMFYGDMWKLSRDIQNDMLKPTKLEELEHVLKTPILTGGRYGSLAQEVDKPQESIVRELI